MEVPSGLLGRGEVDRVGHRPERLPNARYTLARAVLVLTIYGWVYQRLLADREVPIYVQDLVDAVRAKKWVKQYDDGATANPATTSNAS